ncbi:TTF-type domain-containing protein [Trichonephila clavipes]|nr:TTF-type domain-containing protein [Trichonephila clavipes]
MGIMESGWSAKRVTRQLGYSDYVVRRRWNQWIREMTFTRRPGSERPRQTSRRDDHHIVTYLGCIFHNLSIRAGLGVKRYRDKGKKWESGAAKRKRKAERAVSNQVLSSEEKIEISSSPVNRGNARDAVKYASASFEPGLWTFPMTIAHRHDIAQSSPTQQLNNIYKYYPMYEDHRHFSNFHFLRKLNKGETHNATAGWFIQVLKIKFSVTHADYVAVPKLKWYRKGAVIGNTDLSSILHRHGNTKEHMAYIRGAQPFFLLGHIHMSAISRGPQIYVSYFTWAAIWGYR